MITKPKFEKFVDTINKLYEFVNEESFIERRRCFMKRVVNKTVVLSIVAVLCIGTVGVASVSAASQPKTTVKTTR